MKPIKPKLMKKERKIYYPPHADDMELSMRGVCCVSVENVYDSGIDDYTYEDKSSDYTWS